MRGNISATLWEPQATDAVLLHDVLELASLTDTQHTANSSLVHYHEAWQIVVLHTHCQSLLCLAIADGSAAARLPTLLS